MEPTSSYRPLVLSGSHLKESSDRPVDTFPVEVTTMKLSILELSVAIIYQGYEAFSTHGDLSQLPQCTQALRNLEAQYRELYSNDREKAMAVKEEIDRLSPLVNEISLRTPSVTDRDYGLLRSFGERPVGVGDPFLDAASGLTYIQPDHSELLKFGSAFFVSGQYIGIGLIRGHMSQGRKCDILYLKKQTDQVEYEEKERIGYARQLKDWLTRKDTARDIVTRIQVQQQLIDRAVPFIVESLPKWCYESYQPCGTQELIENGIDPEYAKQHHAVIFFYTQV